ncbi:hypothetical protein [Marinomonas sp. GJ51-6]|uniref:hypothetical protein n=1 Tax=Marinomonas sp. GJ51-6 TaxID=2992802 RepID=UPI002934CBEC|nr:hypothetical protein [Marinomonas sp. GJ51-6]WOD06149.1 hypothetical protein ONZ50_10395 [Marinomonas sp. GJ51-6]
MLDKRFREFRDKQTVKDFNDADYLEEQAKKVRLDDQPLADRIMRRVEILRQSSSKKKMLISKVTMKVLLCWSER